MSGANMRGRTSAILSAIGLGLLALAACKPASEAPKAAGAPNAVETPEEPASLDWAYAVNPPGAPAEPDAVTVHHIPNSSAGFTMKQARDLSNVPDWRPDSHPKMPDVVAHGRKPGVFACGFCHYPTGTGRPENASLAGLSIGYIAGQMADMKNGLRTNAVKARGPGNGMLTIAKAASDADIDAAARYFSAMTPKPFGKVVEAADVPKTKVASWVYAPDPAGGTEKLGQRIVEMTEDLTRFDLRDDLTPITAYVPVGSVKRGETLVMIGDGHNKICAECHSGNFKGIGDVPPIAGRSPSYIARQLSDFRSGARTGMRADPMKDVVAKMTDRDIMAIAAYLGTLEP